MTAMDTVPVLTDQLLPQISDKSGNVWLPIVLLLPHSIKLISRWFLSMWLCVPTLCVNSLRL